MNFDEISKKFKKFSKDTVEEVQRLNEIRILKGKISDAKKQINEVYSEIGKKIYEQYKESALEGFETEIQTITEKLALIEELKVQVRDVKGVVVCPCCNLEVPAGEKYCSNCGNKMPEVPEEDDDIMDVDDLEADAEEAMEEVAEAAEEAVEEAAEVAEEAADTVEEAVEVVVEEVTEAAEEAAEAVEEKTTEE